MNNQILAYFLIVIIIFAGLFLLIFIWEIIEHYGEDSIADTAIISFKISAIITSGMSIVGAMYLGISRVADIYLV